MNIFEEAKKIIPGGVNSPVRAFSSVGGEPYFVDRADGCRVIDTEGKSYIDYVCSWGPLILGHNNKDVSKAIKNAVDKGTSYGAPTCLEVELANLITKYVPSIEMVRMVNSGTEAVMSAIRLARAFTARAKVIKFEGCYHGHSDSLLVKSGSGLLTLGEPSSPGVPADITKNTLVAEYNNLDSVVNLFKANSGEVACVIVEPVAANMGLVLPKEGFLEGLRKLCTQEGALLIFDEVITGFRLSLSGAQGYFGIKPDLTTLGKIIGGGMPVGAFGGKKEIMDMMSPVGSVYQAGTLSGNPIAMAAGIATLNKLQEESFYDDLNKKSEILWEGFKNNQKKLGLNFAFNYIGSLACIFFTKQEVTSYKQAVSSDVKKYSIYFHNMLNSGIALAPAQFESMFVSAAHNDNDLEYTIKAHYEAINNI